MGPEKRLTVAVAMSEELVSLARAGIRARHPEYDDEAEDTVLSKLEWCRLSADSERGRACSRRPRLAPGNRSGRPHPTACRMAPPGVVLHCSSSTNEQPVTFMAPIT